MGYGLNGIGNKGGSSRGKKSVNGLRKDSRLYGGNSKSLSSPNNAKRHETLQKEAKLYAELARELEEKLSKRNAEIMALRRSNKVLHQECSEHRSKISNLESQCLSRSEKVAQLSDSIAARKSNKVHERLMEKSLEVADLVEETGRLKIQKKHLQENKARNGKLLIEMSEIVRMLNKIDIIYEKVGNEDINGYESDSFHANNQYSDYFLNTSEELPQDIPMENVRRKIRAIDDALVEGKELRKENHLQKSKLEFLRKDNANLNVQIASLEAKLREREEQLNVMEERRNQGMTRTSTNSTEANDSDYTFRTYSDESSKEVSYEDFVVDNDRSDSDSEHSSEASEDTGIIDSYRSGDADERDPLFTDVDRSLSTVDECNDDGSDNSSFSSVELPPSQAECEQTKTSSEEKQTTGGIPAEEHIQLQNNFEKALDVIEKLKSDLSRHESNILDPDSPDNPLKEDLEESSKEVLRLRYELKETLTKYEELKEEYQALHDRLGNELETSKRIRMDLEATYEEKLVSIEQASKQDIEELTTRNKHLENQYNDLETEYSLKIESLEQKLKETKHSSKNKKEDGATRIEILEEELKEHQQEMKKFKKQYDAMESVHQERVETLLKEHTERVDLEKKKYEDLRYEYDTFLEIHLKLEEDAEQAKNHYKDSLIKIRNLESEAKKSKDAAANTEENHKELTENTNIAHQEAIQKTKETHQKELNSKEFVILEWKGKFTKLKRDHVSAIKSHNEATQKFIAEIKQIKKDHGVAMAKQGRLRQSDAAKYKKLRREFDMSLVEYGKKEQITIHKYEESKREYESKIQDYERKLSEFQKLFSFSKEGDNKTLQEKIQSLESESKKKVEKLQEELIETSKGLETEANQRFLKAQAESIEKIDKLVEINQRLQEQATKQEQELKKHRKGQEFANANYKELTTSYQASLLKIEFLVNHQEGITQQTEDTSNEECEKSTRAKGGTVMERIKQLERKKSAQSNSVLSQPQINMGENSSRLRSVVEEVENKTGGQLLQPKPSLENTVSLENTSHQSGSDPGFERDFGTIIAKVRADSSPMGSNLEVASVASSVGSSLTGNTILETIHKRVDHQSQGIEVSQRNESTQSQPPIVHMFERSNLYLILKHFEQWREVNSAMRRLPQAQTPNVYGVISEEVITSPDQDIDINRIISNLLLHKKGFDSVQNSIVRQNIVTQFDELSPSRLIELFPSEYSNSQDSGDLGFDELYNSASNELQGNLISAVEGSTGSNDTNNSARMAQLEAERLQGEHLSMQMYMNTEEIKFKTREKEMRLLDLKYQNLRQEFEQLKLGKSTTDFRANHKTKEIRNLQKKVLVAELKAELTKRDLEEQKMQINEDEQEQNESVTISSDDVNQDNYKDGHFGGSDNFQNDHAESDDSEDFEFHRVSTSSVEPQDGKSGSFGTETEGTAEETDCTTTEHEDEDDDSNREEINSLEPQEEKPKSFGSGTRGTEDESLYYDETEGGSDDDNSNDDDSETINSIEAPSVEFIQDELRKAKEAAEAARRKQLEREQNLRDVIFQYKKLQKQHEDALAKNQIPKISLGVIQEGDAAFPPEEVVGELKIAQANVSAMKKQLEAACGKHTEEKEHIQNVKTQFESLQVDFLKILAEKQELEKAVYQRRPGLASGVVPAANNNNRQATQPQPRFKTSTGPRMAPNAGGNPGSTRPMTSRPATDRAPANGATGPLQRPRINPSPNDTSGTTQPVTSQKIVSVFSSDRVPSNGPIRPMDPTRTAPISTPTSNPSQAAQPRSNPYRLAPKGQSQQQQLQYQQQQQYHPQQQQQRLPGSPPRLIYQQQPNWQQQQQQQQKNSPRLEQKHPSRLQQPTENLLPQAQREQPQRATKKRMGIFRGWRSRTTAAATKPQKQ